MLIIYVVSMHTSIDSKLANMDKIGVGKRIREARKRLKITQAELGRACNVSPSAVTQWEKGMTEPSAEAMHLICIRLGVGPNWVIYGKNPNRGNAAILEESYTISSDLSLTGKVPVISWVQAGDWNEAADPYALGDGVDFIYCPVKHSPSTYCLQVRGESNAPHYLDGDYVFVDPLVEPINKKMVIAKNIEDNTVTFKQLIVDENSKKLKALNEKWEPRFIELGKSHRISGVVIGGFRPA